MPRFAAHLGPVLWGVATKCRQSGARRFTSSVMRRHSSGSLVKKVTTTALGIFAEQVVGAVLQALLHRFDLVPRSTTHAARGVSAAAAVSGAYP